MTETVFVVERVDGKWDASCFDRRCGGWGVHGVGGDDGVHETEDAAQRAATEHRRELAATREPSQVPAVVCPTCGHRNVPKERRWPMPETTPSRELNPYEANRELFEELDRELKAASAAMDADDMDAWNTHAGRASELYEQIAERFGWDTRAPRYDEEADDA